MTRCTSCNWSNHDASVHGETCAKGHAIAVVGRYKDGKCKACQRAHQRRHDAKHRERNRERNRRWRLANRTHDSSGDDARRDNRNRASGGRLVAEPEHSGAAAGAAASTS